MNAFIGLIYHIYSSYAYDISYGFSYRIQSYSKVYNQNHKLKYLHVNFNSAELKI